MTPARCADEPMPAEAMFRVLGLAFASATKSRTVLTGSDGCTVRIASCATTIEIGTKSCNGSKPIFL